MINRLSLEIFENQSTASLRQSACRVGRFLGSSSSRGAVPQLLVGLLLPQLVVCGCHSTKVIRSFSKLSSPW